MSDPWVEEALQRFLAELGGRRLTREQAARLVYTACPMPSVPVTTEQAVREKELEGMIREHQPVGFSSAPAHPEVGVAGKLWTLRDVEEAHAAACIDPHNLAHAERFRAAVVGVLRRIGSNVGAL